MRAVINWGRIVAAALLSAFTAPFVFATAAGSARSTATHRAPDVPPAAERTPPGDPILGVLLIIGIVGVLILAAWLFSRVSDSDDGRASDKSIV